MSVVISKESVKRLIKDVKQLKIDPLHDQGIYYKHDEDDMLKGHALIIGPKTHLTKMVFIFLNSDFLLITHLVLPN